MTVYHRSRRRYCSQSCRDMKQAGYTAWREKKLPLFGKQTKDFLPPLPTQPIDPYANDTKP